MKAWLFLFDCNKRVLENRFTEKSLSQDRNF